MTVNTFYNVKQCSSFESSVYQRILNNPKRDYASERFSTLIIILINVFEHHISALQWFLKDYVTNSKVHGSIVIVYQN